MIDLPSSVGVGIDMNEGISASAMKVRGTGKGELRDVKMRNINGSNGNGKIGGGAQVKFDDEEEAKGESVKHYDADGMSLPTFIIDDF